MTLRPSARCCALCDVGQSIEGKKWGRPGRGWMSKSSVALVAGLGRRKASGKASKRLFCGTAIACIVIGAGWTVYNNIIAASLYPTLGTASYDEPVFRPRIASRSTAEIISDVFAALPEPTPVIAKPETVAAI